MKATQSDRIGCRKHNESRWFRSNKDKLFSKQYTRQKKNPEKSLNSPEKNSTAKLLVDTQSNIPCRCPNSLTSLPPPPPQRSLSLPIPPPGGDQLLDRLSPSPLPQHPLSWSHQLLSTLSTSVGQLLGYASQHSRPGHLLLPVRWQADVGCCLLLGLARR